MKRDGVLLTAHGSVEDLDDMPAFVARIRHGRPAPPALIEELRRRYSAIGGSPLLRVTRRQAELLSEVTELPVFVGMRLWRPELTEAITAALAQGVERLCVLPLAPYSVQVYTRAAERALQSIAGGSLELVAVTPYGSHPELVRAHSEAIAPYLEAAGSDAELVLTAHSLPSSVIAAGDAYAVEVEASVRAIGDRLGRAPLLAYQSQGADGGDWLGPGLREVLAAAKARGKRSVVIAPVGFPCDHVETLYDLDIEARAWSAELGLEFSRVPALNTDPLLIQALGRVVLRALSD